ncbi:hypothetical protein MXD59_13390 [Frankia sp. Ag45/Mut15]|uniref:Uncharacterized protein n=1 Tax=Frankia umida TaxID=573489 RepID=A0ABT0JZ77_9ACTN|nr:hypothetical protein [Frankia umida]MCK9876760.1 hypothetical protein [Frankia umida]
MSKADDSTDDQSASDAPGSEAKVLDGSSTSLRPVDWDGGSSRIWDSRHGNDVTNQLAAEADERWSEEILQQLREERQETEREEGDDRG